MHNPQYDEDRNSNADIQDRLRMEIHDFYHAGPPEDDANLIQLLLDAQNWIRQAKAAYSIPELWPVKEED